MEGAETAIEIDRRPLRSNNALELLILCKVARLGTRGDIGQSSEERKSILECRIRDNGGAYSSGSCFARKSPDRE
jgi:hypothetical protein